MRCVLRVRAVSSANPGDGNKDELSRVELGSIEAVLDYLWESGQRVASIAMDQEDESPEELRSFRDIIENDWPDIALETIEIA